MTRPRKSTETKRVRLSTTVAPATMKALEKRADLFGSLGLVIDFWYWRVELGEEGKEKKKF